jgi:hypothetical protein
MMRNISYKNLACYQLKLLIRKGDGEARKEWRRRWCMDFPFYKSAKGIEKEDE